MLVSPFSRPLVCEQLPGHYSATDLTQRLVGLPAPCVLESSLRVGDMGRWHVFAAAPIGALRLYGERFEREQPNGVIERGTGAPWRILVDWWSSWREAGPPDSVAAAAAGLPLTGGAIGYLGYELGEYLEELGAPRGRDPKIPDAHLCLYDELLLVDAASGVATFVHRNRDGVRERRWWERSAPAAAASKARATPLVEHAPSLSDVEFLAAVSAIRAAIGRGDVYQTNLTRRHHFTGGPDLWELFRRLRTRQPVPYAACLPWEPVGVVSASPERFLFRTGACVETRPIKGTAPRTGHAEVDAQAAAALLASEKQRAELAMIIDLLRNDLGRVCEVGSIVVAEESALEHYSTVSHTVATVRGELDPRRSPIALLRATFPGGSITGAPKIAAMKQIRALEPTPRKVYTGALGWIAPDGALDLAIAIRTAYRHGAHTYFSVGGGITWDSDPHEELAEIEAKGRAIFAALRE
ncbi:MAG: anthranilate synthase component I family protein [Planctomycetota bacterium]